MLNTGNRKATFKLPPSQGASSQQARREKALEDQKRRRAQKFDLSRQLDGFADLNLAGSDEEDEERNQEGVRVVHSGLASFTSSFEATSPTQANKPITSPTALLESNQAAGPSNQRKKKKKKRSNRVGGGGNQQWADKCMYAELLEMHDIDTWSQSQGNYDGLPEDLETGWVAVGPVPLGKRCLAISRDSSGNGVGMLNNLVPRESFHLDACTFEEPNTTLRSRVLGKPLLPWFPSNLPPHTVLDCILDENWRTNGLLHVLDVLQWKGRDIADCETPFRYGTLPSLLEPRSLKDDLARFWWRDMRVAELPPVPPPTSTSAPKDPQMYQFAYPTTLVPVPHNTDTSVQSLLRSIIPSARSQRPIDVMIPNVTELQDGMEVDSERRPLVAFKANIASDGLLLYVAEACYESGTSPLSSWIPMRSFDTDAMQTSEVPLDLFEKLVRKRAERKGTSVEDSEML
ncbi:hypothetical protein PQX77_010189 [Marasmius sp. AFHP31]|nr:hypothetical protein PQX77_010189 [Marasmius sp. AFHP31]